MLVLGDPFLGAEPVAVLRGPVAVHQVDRTTRGGRRLLAVDMVGAEPEELRHRDLLGRQGKAAGDPFAVQGFQTVSGPARPAPRLARPRSSAFSRSAPGWGCRCSTAR